MPGDLRAQQPYVEVAGGLGLRADDVFPGLGYLAGNQFDPREAHGRVHVPGVEFRAL